MRRPNATYHLVAILTVVIWGLTFISTKVLLRHGLSPQEIFFYRFLIAYAGIWALVPKRLLSDNWRDELWLALAGVCGGSLYFYTENTALGITHVSNVAFLVCTAPLITTILSLLLYKGERATRGLVYGSLLALVGVALIVFGGGGALRLSPTGDLLSLAAALSWAFYSLIIKKMAGRYSTAFITRKVFFYGLLTILPAFVAEPLRPHWPTLLGTEVLLNLVFLAVLASLVCYAVWNVVLKRLGTVRATNYIYLNPLVAMVASTLILGERMAPVAIAGAACILLGVYLAEKR
ncbi:MAG: DMT family transporter [Mediterranea sp.]|jgi:drug/metabolite transporter (DMT)-like permease|nr:DMT family transporter [Mediterranea sp.]